MRHRLHVAALSIVACAFFLYPYFALYNFVGRFPAESPTVARPTASALHAICYPSVGPDRKIAMLTPEGAAADGLSLALKKNLTAKEQVDVGRSRDLYYSRLYQRLYAIDFLGEDDAAFLNRLAAARSAAPAGVAAFIAQAKSFAKPCNIPIVDSGITEAYWSTKGTNILHHWAYLYDSSVRDGRPVHGQYGYLVSSLARWMSDVSEPGPTGFVRTAWVVYAILGVVFIALFFYIFRAHASMAFAAVCWKVLVFITLTPFSILLAPGYHWARELALILPVFLFVLSARRLQRGRPARLTGWIVFNAALVVTAYVLDPTFCILGIAGLLVATLITAHREIVAYVLARKKLAAIVITAAIASLLLSVATDLSNLHYIASSLLTAGSFFSLSRLYLSIIEFNFVLAIIVVVMSWKGYLGTPAAYFAIISFPLAGYYMITPDDFHFRAYLGYLIPLYASVAVAIASALTYDNKEALSSLIDGFIRSHVMASARGRILMRYCLQVIFFLVAILCIAFGLRDVSQQPWAWQLRISDSARKPFFASAPFIINGKYINADLSDATVRHLRNFPRVRDFRYLISPIDKYLLMLYNVHNGFNSADFVSSMDTYEKLHSIEANIVSSGGVVVIDMESLEVDPSAAILSNNRVMGNINEMSALNVQSRLRVAELASFVISRCKRESASSRWLIVRCAGIL